MDVKPVGVIKYAGVGRKRLRPEETQFNGPAQKKTPTANLRKTKDERVPRS